jgi:hypothetical protein
MRTTHLYYCNKCGQWRGKNKECPECKIPCGEKDVPLRRAGLYFIEGVDEPLPSVTSILGLIPKPALEYWKIKQAVIAALTDPSLSIEEAISAIYVKRDKAGTEGSDAHRIINHFAADGDKGEEYHGKIKAYIDAYRRFCKEVEHRVIQSEQVVYNRKYKYAGTLDAVIQTKDRRALLDYKTSNYIAEEYHLQLVAYREALKEMNSPVDGAMILHLKEDGTYSLIESNGDFDVFLAALKIYNWKK